MEILLINPFPENASGINEATIEPPLGIAYLASYLELFGHVCQIIDANILEIKSKEIQKYISLKNPSIIGISANIVTCKSGFITAKELKETFPDSKIIIGGPYPTSLSEYFIEKDQIDAVVVGEGEITLKEIVDNLDNKKEDIFEFPLI